MYSSYSIHRLTSNTQITGKTNTYQTYKDQKLFRLKEDAKEARSYCVESDDLWLDCCNSSVKCSWEHRYSAEAVFLWIPLCAEKHHCI